MNNPMQKLQEIGTFIKGMKNPQEAIIQMLMNNSNPMAKNILKMVENKDYNGIENFARNVCKEQGKDFDKEITDFKNKIGL